MSSLYDLIKGSELSKVNLHIHSTHSDGECAPKEIFDEAQKQGMNLISLNDHNRLPRLEDYSAWKTGGYHFKYIPGIEVSCGSPETNRIHLLGYFDPDRLYSQENQQNASEFEEILKKIREGLKKRVTTAIGRFNEYAEKNNPSEFSRNGPITLEEVVAAASKIKNIGIDKVEIEPAHLAMPIIRRGYAKDGLDAKFLVEENGILPGYDDQSWYKPSAEEGIVALKKVGATDIVLAHPGLYLKYIDHQKMTEVVERLKGYGLTGIELGYQYLKLKDQDKLKEFLGKLCDAKGLYPTIGGDNHTAKEIIGPGLLSVKTGL